MSYGFLGRIIRVDLTSGSITIEKPGETFYRKYLGGKGLVAYYLLKELPGGVDPLGPDNKLVFATGVLTGVPAPALPRFVVGAKSPLTGGFGQSEAGGFWGPELKKAGYDAIIVEGCAEKPVYLYIKDDDIQIRDAQHLWGLETGQAQEAIRWELGDDKVRLAIIGTGGENLVRYACIINELKHANGRNGLGAVMGSKKLKAIVVRGSGNIPVAEPEKIPGIRKDIIAELKAYPLTQSLYELGTAGAVISLNAGGILPTRNFNYGELETAERISGEAMAETILKRREGCYACSIRCKRAVEVSSGEITVDPKYGGPEYETIASFGSLCQIDDLVLLAKAHELCNKYSIDSISTGCSIAFAMECYEKGLLTREDCDGLEVKFGNKDVILPLIDMIAQRRGIGDILAEGTHRAAKIIGRGAEDFALTVKRQELPMHDPRGKVAVGIGYALSETGADHMTAAHDPLFANKGIVLDTIFPLGITKPVGERDLTWKKIRAFMYLKIWWSFSDMAGICHFGPVPRGGISINNIIRLLKAVTGWDTSLWELMKAGERSINMARLFNLREGFTREDDILPKRLFTPLKKGRLKGVAIPEDEFRAIISLYYAMMGWDEEGVPGKGKLLELQLAEFLPMREEDDPDGSLLDDAELN